MLTVANGDSYLSCHPYFPSTGTKSTLPTKFEQFWKKISLEQPYARWNFGIVEIENVNDDLNYNIPY